MKHSMARALAARSPRFSGSSGSELDRFQAAGYPNDQALHAFTPTCAMPSHPGAMLRLVLRVIRVRVRLDRVMRHAFGVGRHVMRHASVTSSL